MQYVVKVGNRYINQLGKLTKNVNNAYLFPTRELARYYREDYAYTNGKSGKVYQLNLTLSQEKVSR